jgi:predicted transport protein
MKIDWIIGEILNGGKNEKMIPSPYDMLSAYTAHLAGRVAAYTIKQNIITAKNFLEYYDIEVSPKKFKLKVKLPKSVRKDKQPLSKEDIVDILNACSNIQLKTTSCYSLQQE